MKKIIIAFDGQHFSEGAFEFALQLHGIKPVSITGVFLSAVDYTAILNYPLLMGAPETYIEHMKGNDQPVLAGNIKDFEERCNKHNIPYKVHNSVSGLVFEELKKESRFADFIILSSELFYKNIGDQPNDYLKEVLQNVECPVVLVPEKYEFPTNIILSYDGTESSVFAIKQFIYLFPELCNRKTLLVYFSEKDIELPYSILIEELVQRHFSDISFYKLDNNAANYFSNWLLTQKNPLVISGSFGRSGFAQLFKKSFLTAIIKDHIAPVFIAHK